MIPAGRIPRRLRRRVSETLDDFQDFCGSYLRLPDKSGQTVPFDLRPAQVEVADALARSNRLALPKARQLGVSRTIRAWHLYQAWGSPDPLTLATIAHHFRAAGNLHGISRDFLATMPDLVRPPLARDTATELVLDPEWGGSTLACYSAGSSSGTRSWTLHGAHVSELAYAADPVGLMASVAASVGHGQIVVESTATGPGDLLHRICTGGDGWDVVFLAWTLDPDYTADPLDTTLDPETGLTGGQLRWWNQQVSLMGEDDARREYPWTLEDCFRPGSGTWITVPPHVRRVPGPPRGILYEEAPDPDDAYVLGVDPAGGTGQDHATIVALSRRTGQIVYAWRSPTTTPVQLAHHVLTVGTRYHTALVLCESNNHGHAVLSTLAQLGYHRRWGQPGTGKPWVTTHQSKIQMMEALRTWVMGECAMMPEAVAMEVASLRLQDSGTPAAPAGMHDDLAVALALACTAAPSVPIPGGRVSPQKSAMMQHLAKTRTTRRWA